MNLLKERILNKQFVLGTMLSELATPNVARVLSAGGFSFLIVDCEHGYFDSPQVASIIGVAKGANFPVVVRIPEIKREVITKYLDMGADGLLVPMVSTKEDIETVVKYAKYAPLGQRGISTQRIHTNYAPPPLEEYMAFANQHTVILPQIETNEGVANIDEIAAVKGVDAIMIGPNDLAADCKTPGNFGTYLMKKNIAAVIAGAAKAGKPSGIISGNIPFLQDCRSQGMSVFSCDSEVGMLLKASKNIVKEF